MEKIQNSEQIIYSIVGVHKKDLKIRGCSLGASELPDLVDYLNSLDNDTLFQIIDAKNISWMPNVKAIRKYYSSYLNHITEFTNIELKKYFVDEVENAKLSVSYDEDMNLEKGSIITHNPNIDGEYKTFRIINQLNLTETNYHDLKFIGIEKKIKILQIKIDELLSLFYPKMY